MKVLAIAGSLREQSYNRGLVRAAQALAPSGMTITVGDIAAVPMYNGDDDGDNRPATVVALAEQVAQADALLFATPAYKYSCPLYTSDAAAEPTCCNTGCRPTTTNKQ